MVQEESAAHAMPIGTVASTHAMPTGAMTPSISIGVPSQEISTSQTSSKVTSIPCPAHRRQRRREVALLRLGQGSDARGERGLFEVGRVGVR